MYINRPHNLLFYLLLQILICNDTNYSTVKLNLTNCLPQQAADYSAILKISYLPYSILSFFDVLNI